MIGQSTGLRWFVYAEPGVTCLRGTQYWGTCEGGRPCGCRGDIGDLVSLSTWHDVELVTYNQGYWIARVYTANGVAVDVAKIWSPITTIYDATMTMEEAYTGAVDPHYPSDYFLSHPKYMSSGSFTDWPQSEINSILQNKARVVSNSGEDICPAFYGISPNLFWDSRKWEAWTGGPACNWLLFPPINSVNVYDDPSSSDYKGNWTHSSGIWPRSYGNTVSWSNTEGDLYSFSFHGYRISRVYNMGPNRGYERIYIDGNDRGRQNDYSASNRWQVAKTWIVSQGDHTIQVEVDSGNYVDLDAFVVDVGFVGAGTFDDWINGTSNVKYIGTWTHSSGWPLAHNQSLSWSNTSQDAFALTFEGREISYYYTKSLNRGIAEVVIDGVNKGSIDLYSASPAWQSYSTFSNLGTGIHTIHISVSGQKNQASSDFYIDLDKFVVVH